MKGLLAVLGGGGHLQNADRKTKHLEDGRHPARVAARQVIVNGHEMSPVAGEGVQVHGQSSDQGLAFPGLHLGNLAAVQDDAADQLNVVMAEADGSLGGLTHSGKGLRQDIFQRILLGLIKFFLSFGRDSITGSLRSEHWRRGEPGAELGRLGAQRLIGELFELRLQSVDLFDLLAELLELAFVGVAPDRFHEFLEHNFPFGKGIITEGYLRHIRKHSGQKAGMLIRIHVR